MIKEIVMPRQPAQWCKNQSKDGRVCSLYIEHFGDHKENHGKSSWKGGE